MNNPPPPASFRKRRWVAHTSDSLPKRVFVDASHTLDSGINTGVQRVVRSACEFLPQACTLQDAVVVTVGRDEFEIVDQRQRTPEHEKFLEFKGSVLGSMPGTYVNFARRVCNVLGAQTLRRWLLPMPGHQGIFKLPIKLYERTMLQRAARQPAHPGEGDLLILPDAYWVKPEIWAKVKAARERGAFVATVVYDLIPMTHPHFVAEGAPESFTAYIRKVAANSDLMIAISNTVRDQVRAVLPELCSDESRCREVRSFELGAQFMHKTGFIRDEIKQIFSPDSIDNPYLMVSTFDPRKNHSYLLDAFEKIWERDPTRKLCLVGRVGWLCRDVMDRVWGHPRLGKQLFAMHDVSDAELNYCYQQARAIVFSSIVEGFGLPIVEALWHGRYVFASDTPIHREVGGAECYYFDLNRPSSLANQVLQWESQFDHVSPSRKSKIRPLNWLQSIEMLIAECTDSYTRQRHAALHSATGRLDVQRDAA